MIKIEYPTDKDFHTDFFIAIRSKKDTSEIDDIFKRYNLKINNDDLTFEKLVTLTFEEIIELSKIIGKKNEDKFNETEITIFNKWINYKNKREKINQFLIDTKEVVLNTCFYCNMDHIYSFIDENDETRNHFTLDHILPKGEYKIFSICLYNLIPSCSPCNSKFKHNKEFTINDNLNTVIATSTNYSFNKDFKFKVYYNQEVEKFKDINDLKIQSNYDKTNINIKEYLRIFRIKERYDFHENKGLDIVEKRINYSDSFIEEMSKLTGRSKEDFYRDLFGKELFDKEYNTDPFIKFKRDIANNIGIKGVLS
ncbi:HNH endonuclease [Aureivirga sp. CE67]|uniref:HNH endonuclease n=1 Tax=Aureivirga sp. CE67 TaxID=1788983 RepID=UPI0018CAF2E8|nr:hypothetical protein [Aureivirga sp. CE67]